MKHTFEILAKADKKTLEKIMKEGNMPDIESMVGWEFDGYNLTFMATILGIRKFRKGFYKEKGNYKGYNGFIKGFGKEEDKYKGYNVKMKQNKFGEPWKYKCGKPERFGWFDIVPAVLLALGDKDAMYLNALLLHYGLDNRNSVFEGKMLRDFLVQVNENDKDLYLGKAYNAVGKKLVMPSYFILKRAEEVKI